MSFEAGQFVVLETADLSGGRAYSIVNFETETDTIELLLKPQGYKVDKARSPVLVREAIKSTAYDAILIDLNYTRDTTSGQEGLDLLSEIVAIDATLPVIVMTAWGNIDLAVEAMRRGANDFIQKPWENARLLSVLRTQMELYRSQPRPAMGFGPGGEPNTTRASGACSTRPGRHPTIRPCATHDQMAVSAMAGGANRASSHADRTATGDGMNSRDNW